MVRFYALLLGGAFSSVCSEILSMGPKQVIIPDISLHYVHVMRITIPHKTHRTKAPNHIVKLNCFIPNKQTN